MMKKLLSLILMLTLFASILPTSASALVIDDNAAYNWDAMAVKFATRTKYPILIVDGDGNKVPKTEGFEYLTNKDGGIQMKFASYDVFPGANGASVITSKHKTPLGGLSVDITLDNFDFQNDPHYISNNIGILWTEEPITNLDALETSDFSRFYGIGRLIPNKKDSEGFAYGIPASAAKADEISGKALYISLNNSFTEPNITTKTATTLTIVYYDGHFINEADGYYGYRWIFTTTNLEDAYDDEKYYVGDFNDIDLSEGLKVSVKEDNKLGYIVNINGKDYYKGSDITNFPSANRYGYAHDDINPLNIDNSNDIYIDSMTFLKNDIDLSGLVDADMGYLTIGVTGIDDKNFDHGADITVNTINGEKAVEWMGNNNCQHSEKVWKITKEPFCGNEGTESYICTSCGKNFETRSVPAKDEHIYPNEWLMIKFNTCITAGEGYKICKVCSHRITQIFEPSDTLHKKVNHLVLEPTCTDEGILEVRCRVCGYIFEDETVTLPNTGHSFITYSRDGNATCIEDGTKTSKCEYCDTTDTLPDPGSALGHKAGEWIITKEATYTEVGEKYRCCTRCNIEIEREEISRILFTDNTDAKKWYYESINYCSQNGYVIGVGNNMFAPDSNMSREQFVTVLARVAGADLTNYVKSRYTDVDPDAWYAPSVMWAEQEGLVYGIGNDKFGVGQVLNRESLATLFYRFSEKMGMDVSLKEEFSDFIDADNISSWAFEACVWSIETGLLGSTSVDYNIFSPQMNVNRAQATQIFMNYDKLF